MCCSWLPRRPTSPTAPFQSTRVRATGLASAAFASLSTEAVGPPRYVTTAHWDGLALGRGRRERTRLGTSVANRDLFALPREVLLQRLESIQSSAESTTESITDSIEAGKDEAAGATGDA